MSLIHKLFIGKFLAAFLCLLFVMFSATEITMLTSNLIQDLWLSSVMVTYCFRWCAMNRIAIGVHSLQYDCISCDFHGKRITFFPWKIQKYTFSLENTKNTLFPWKIQRIHFFSWKLQKYTFSLENTKNTLFPWKNIKNTHFSLNSTKKNIISYTVFSSWNTGYTRPVKSVLMAKFLEAILETTVKQIYLAEVPLYGSREHKKLSELSKYYLARKLGDENPFAESNPFFIIFWRLLQQKGRSWLSINFE